MISKALNIINGILKVFRYKNMDFHASKIPLTRFFKSLKFKAKVSALNALSPLSRAMHAPLHFNCPGETAALSSRAPRGEPCKGEVCLFYHPLDYCCSPSALFPASSSFILYKLGISDFEVLTSPPSPIPTCVGLWLCKYGYGYGYGYVNRSI